MLIGTNHYLGNSYHTSLFPILGLCRTSARRNFVVNTCYRSSHIHIIFGMALTFFFVHTHPRLLLLMRILQFFCSLVLGIGLIVTLVMSWVVNNVSIKLAGTFLIYTQPTCVNSHRLNNIISSRIHRCHALPCLEQLCLDGFSFSGNTSPPP